MKKTYKAPGVLVVNIRTNHMLAESIYSNENETITIESEGGWVKEQNTFSDKNIWEDEW